MKNEILKRLSEGKRFSFHSCGICDFKCHYIVHNQRLFYDSGCYCVRRYSNIQPRELIDIDEILSMNPTVDYLQQEYWMEKV